MTGSRVGVNHMQLKRYITIDNLNKVIYIQVKYDMRGQLQEQEYHDMMRGEWYKYVPADFLEQFRKAITGGFRVQPVVISGMINEDYQVLQLVDLKEVKNNRILKPVLEV